MLEKIDKNNVQDVLELNKAQKGMLFHYVDDNNGNLYTIQLCLNIIGELSIDTLKEAFNIVQENNEVLRIVFEWEKASKPVQIVLKNASLDFNFFDVSSHDTNYIENFSTACIKRDRSEKFNLRKVPIRINVIKTGDKSFIFNITHHHILYDGWSTGILLKELFVRYNEIRNNSRHNEIQKPSYKSALQGIAKNYDENASKSYWSNYLKSYEIKPWFDLQYGICGAGEKINVLRSEISIDKLNQFAAANKVTRAAIIYTAYGILLQKYANTDDVIFGTPVSNRDASIGRIDTVMGNFINTIPLRVADTDNKLLLDITKNINEELIVRNQFKGTSYDEIKKVLNLKPKDNLFDSILVIENYPLDLDAINCNQEFAIQLKSTYGDTGLPLVIHVFFREKIEIEIMYQTSVIQEDYIRSFSQHFISMINSIIEYPHKSINVLTCLSSEETQKFLFDFNNTKNEREKEKTVLDLFQQQVRFNPKAIAISFKERTITYEELDELSNQIAYYLIKKYNIHADDRIGVMLDRGDWMILSILAILKSGGAYVPIDPDYPVVRKKNIVSDSGIKLLISEMYYVFDIDYCECPIIAIDVEFEKGKFPSAPLSNTVSPNHLAYVLYTSGSTGNPKGVMIEHKSLTNYIVWASDQYVGQERGNFPLYTSISFDLTVTSVFTPLSTGSTIIIYREDDKNLIEKVFLDEKCDIIKLTPSHLKIIRDSELISARDFAGRKKLIVGGEKLETALAKDIHTKYSGKVDIYNEYGPTEATVGCMIFKYSQEVNSLSVPIGKPIRNMQIYLLDRFLEPLPPGAAGELFIAGAGIARGYINKKELANQKFTDAPFVRGQRMYRTGDLAVRMPSGDLEFIGRKDDQVKIRGFRIELGDIQSQLLLHDLITHAIVTVNDRAGDKHLTCYYISEQKIKTEEIKKFLSDKLPDYMIPSSYIQIESVPLTINGKINYKALPDPNVKDVLSMQYVAPETLAEQALALIWQNILGIEKVGIEDDFFALGGQSLSAMRLVSKIKSELSVIVSLDSIFEHTNIKKLAHFIDQQKKTSLPLITKVNHKPEHVPLSFGQERLWFMDQLNGSVHYHLPLVLRLEGKIDAGFFYRTIQILINRHESLRTVFRSRDGKPYQYVLPGNQWEMDVIDISASTLKQVTELIDETIRKPFDLSEDHMLRVKLLQNGLDMEKVIMVMHHIAFDGWSVPVFIRELSSVYQSFRSGVSFQLPELPIQYTDYSIWQNKYLSGKYLEKGLAYWSSKLNGVEPIHLPTDFKRLKFISNKGSDYRFSIDKETSDSIIKISNQEGASMFMALLSVIKILLSKVSGQTDICVGTPTANRGLPEVESAVGFFVNTLALRSHVIHCQSFVELLQQVKQTTIEAFKYQEIPFEKVIDHTISKRDLSRSPLFQVMFILQSEGSLGDINFSDAKAVPLEWDPGISKFELTFEVIHTSQDDMEVKINYCTDLFSLETIRKFGLYLQRLLTAIINNPHEQIGKLQILSKEEVHQLLVGFNNTKTVYPEGLTIMDLFAGQVKLTPNATAVIFDDQVLSFKELDLRSNQLANVLIDQGISPGTLVPICLDRSLEMIIGIIGVLKTGSAYVPIDPEYPQERINFMLEDVAASLVLCQSKYISKLKPNNSIKCLSLDTEWLYDDRSEINPDVEISGNHLAYVIYTSGTTGKPKGVMNHHSGIYNRLVWMKDYLNILDDDVILQKTTFCFDVSVWELLLPLIAGVKMVLAKPNVHKDNIYLESLISQHKVTIVHFVPSMLSAFLLDAEPNKYGTLRNVICSGEELKLNTVLDFRSKLKSTALHNLYGPTEAAIDVTAVNLQQHNSYIPIGKPIANTQIYIVDQCNNIQPAGIHGELLIGGVQVARGYLNRPELTKQKFVLNTIEKNNHYKLYRTGDLARWLSDGNIEYLGRIDHQVKIRGYRIELGEIEVALEQCDGVKQAVVIVKEDTKGNKWLSAYILGAGFVNIASVKNQLKGKLPEYMVPLAIVARNEFPLSPNGKIDRKKLAEQDIQRPDAGVYIPPVSENEKRIADIWKEMLEIEKVGIRDNFFDLGGHSLLVIRVLSAINKEFSIRISVNMFFQMSTIDELSKYLEVISLVKNKENEVNVNAIEL